MRYVYAEEKPPPGEVVEHYGVKGMKWGVRRTQAQLDRAAGRKVREHKKKGGASTLPNRYTGSGKNIRESRRIVSQRKGEMRDIAKNYKKAGSQDQKQKFENEYAKALHEHRSDHNLQRASNLTFGELAAIGLLATPVTAVAAYAVTTANAGRIARRGNNLNLAEDKKLMNMKVGDLEKEALDFMNEEAKK